MKKDSMGLTPMTDNQLYPRMAKPEDFMPAPPKPVTDVTPKFEEQPEGQFAPRTTQDSGLGASGAGTPAVWGSAKGMNSSQNHGEEGSKSSGMTGVDFKTGMHVCDNPLPK